MLSSTSPLPAMVNGIFSSSVGSAFLDHLCQVPPSTSVVSTKAKAGVEKPTAISRVRIVLGITTPSRLSIFFNRFLRFCFFRSVVYSGQECHVARLNVVQQSQQFAPAHLGAADGTDDLAVLFLFLCCPDGSQPFFQFRDLLFRLFGFIQIFL